jgi:hypothetical protein
MNSFQFLPTVQYSTLVSQLTEAGGYVEEAVMCEKYGDMSVFSYYIASLRELQEFRVNIYLQNIAQFCLVYIARNYRLTVNNCAEGSGWQ